MTDRNPYHPDGLWPTKDGRPEGAERWEDFRIDAEQKLTALQAEVNELWPYRKRAEKAEKERDEWEKIALAAERDADEAEENPRPLTPDDITGEMVRRGHAALVAQTGRPQSVAAIQAVLTAALTEPPRPEGAEEIEAAFETWEHAEYLNGGIDADDKRALADHIAEEMNR